MSVLESVAPKIKEAIQELQEVQCARRMAVAVELGHGHVRFIDDADDIVTESRGQITLQNVNGNFELSIGVARSRFPCNKIKWYKCINTVITFELEKFPPVTKVILTVDSIDQVNNIIAHVKPPPLQRPQTYEHDGNLTSSGSESEDSARGRTTSSVNNSFESDEPSSTSENL